MSPMQRAVLLSPLAKTGTWPVVFMQRRSKSTSACFLTGKRCLVFIQSLSRHMPLPSRTTQGLGPTAGAYHLEMDPRQPGMVQLRVMPTSFPLSVILSHQSLHHPGRVTPTSMFHFSLLHPRGSKLIVAKENSKTLWPPKDAVYPTFLMNFLRNGTLLIQILTKSRFGVVLI